MNIHYQHPSTPKQEGTAIVPMSALAKRVDEPATLVKGAAWALGMTIHEVGPSLCVSESDAEEIVRMAKARPIKTKGDRKGRAKVGA